MEKRIAAYGFIFIAGMSSASLGFAFLDGPLTLVRVFTQLSWQSLQFILLAGAAAAVAAGVVQAPFLRALRARRRPRLYAWTLAGVVASHAAYVLLNFFCNAILLPQFAAANTQSLADQFSFALFIGLFSLVLGFIPNTLLGMGFAEILLWLGKRRAAASPA